MTVYIYALIDPTNQNLRYIGKTVNPHNRLKQHLSDKDDSPHKVNWINKLQRQGLKPVLSVLEVCTDADWPDRERFWIRVLQPDLNIGRGGEGNTLPSLPESTREAMSASQRRRHQLDPSLALKTAERMKGNTYSKGIPASEKQRAIARQAKYRAKTWKVKTPDGEEITVFSLQPFCKEHGLSQGNLSQTLTGQRKHHKGYILLEQLN